MKVLTEMKPHPQGIYPSGKDFVAVISDGPILEYLCIDKSGGLKFVSWTQNDGDWP